MGKVISQTVCNYKDELWGALAVVSAGSVQLRCPTSIGIEAEFFGEGEFTDMAKAKNL
jgi:hypothetical protein